MMSELDGLILLVVLSVVLGFVLLMDDDASE